MIRIQIRKQLAPAIVLGILGFTLPQTATAQQSGFRPPAVPLVVFDPYLSIWSMADHLTDDVTRHWTHHPQALTSMIRVDNDCYRLMGNLPKDVPALPQIGLRVTPSQTIYDFENKQIHVKLSFLLPAMPDDLNALTRPVTYIVWTVRSMDGQKHVVHIFDSASATMTVNTTDQKVVWGRESFGPLTALHAGTADQPILQMSGDDTRIDWGYAYLAADSKQATTSIGAESSLLESFASTGTLPATLDARMPRAAKDQDPTMALDFNLGLVGPKDVSRHALITYDEVYSIKYFGEKLRPYWRREGGTPSSLLQEAERVFTYEAQQCQIFDDLLLRDLTAVGGPKYAQIASLSYRQCLAGTGIAADSAKQPLMFTKENTSNGDIATVDVIFPMSPIWILFNPTMAKASLVPVLSYAASSHWKFPNAPHDLGTYPIAKGTDDGGEGMPVEESGNMLIMCDAIAQSESSTRFLAPWWDKLTQWAHYLEQFGLDPEDQLCTDDFMGHLAHNANLSIKAILGLAAYGDLCRIKGDMSNAMRYQKLAKDDAAHWVKVADEGNHSLLAFDQPNTWSQKYNLVWDKILDLNIFPDSVAEREVAYYRSKLLPYGVPLDSRTHLTKTDWSIWSATLARNIDSFEAIISPIYDYLNKTTSREALADSYVTDDIHSDGMHARPVVGGIFIKMLADRPKWRNWTQQDDKQRVDVWAPMPVPPTVVEVVPTSKTTPQAWKYTIAQPPADWINSGFKDDSWKEGQGPFGSEGTPGIAPKTAWTSGDIWLRRELTIPNYKGDLELILYHDEDVEVYVDGRLIGHEGGYVNSYEPHELSSSVRALLKPGAKITLAVHCHQTSGGQGVDVGFGMIVKK
ncbi:MAG: DUF4965 domain-containing protein [Fimbriimonas sp.]|nr:DUF4965 domain-containing protein [Fimbriimonas sp.]